MRYYSIRFKGLNGDAWLDSNGEAARYEGYDFVDLEEAERLFDQEAEKLDRYESLEIHEYDTEDFDHYRIVKVETNW